MKIALTYNLREEETEAQCERYFKSEVTHLIETIENLGFKVTPIEVSVRPEEVIEKLIEATPDLIFNVAEGTCELGIAREAFFPSIFEQMGIPYTGGGPSLLHVSLDKRLSEKLLAIKGITTPRGILLTSEKREIPEDMPTPLIIKPNYEGSSKGIHQSSVVDTLDDARDMIDDLLKDYPEGVHLEQYIPGQELSIPFLEAYPGQLLEIVEHDFCKTKGKQDIYDYELKQTDEGVQVHCPPKLSREIRAKVLDYAKRILQVMPCPDLGRIDLRLHKDGTPYFLEINALPRLMTDGSLILAAKACGLSYSDVFRYIIQSAARRYGIPLPPETRGVYLPRGPRKTCREYGLKIGRFTPGQWNAITDVEGVYVGHVTNVKDNIRDPDNPDLRTRIRTGITAIVPEPEGLFNNHMAAGGFVLNGIGEVSGLTQIIEWGWLETPILLTNTMSIGTVHNGVIRYLLKKYPELGRNVDVIIPVIAETNDSFLNDVRFPSNTADDAIVAIESAHSGPIEQGSVGGGTGMITFDFAGGIGSSSRRLANENGGYTLGVLVQSNFGKMRNLTINGQVIGKTLDDMYPLDIRRGEVFGSIVIVLATDAPLLSSQLNKLAKRATLGLGRTGSFAASTSGELVVAFSTGNTVTRHDRNKEPILRFDFLSDWRMNLLYEAVVECTEEAILNAMFCSRGEKGRKDRIAPALPIHTVLSM